jgi:hypothetical protein
MGVPRVILLAAALAPSILGCRASTAARKDLPAVLLPLSPAPPRLRLASILPDPDAPPARVAWWRTLLRIVTGAEMHEAGEASVLARPFGLAIGAAGELLVADPDSGRVLRFDGGASPSEIACEGSPWQAPMSVAAVAPGEFLVADAGAGRIVRWLDGRCTELGIGFLERPTAVALDGDRMWVADPPRHHVVLFDRDGRVLKTVGERGDGEGQFQFPSALAPLPSGGVAVVDALNFRIVILAADGAWRSAFGAPGASGEGLARPKGVAVDGEDRFWVTDAQRDALIVFDSAGAFAFALGETGTAPGQFAHPAGIAVHGRRLAVADSQNRRVQVFDMIGASP